MSIDYAQSRVNTQKPLYPPEQLLDSNLLCQKLSKESYTCVN